jgi:predicted amidophosphoribosyltransferase
MAQAMQTVGRLGRRLGAGLVTALYPPTCLTCETRIEEAGGLCSACWREMPFIRGSACGLCGVPLPGDAAAPAEEDLRCDACLALARPWDAGRAALLYEGAGRRFVLALKHGDRLDHADGASRWLLRAARGLVGARTVFVPVPLHPWRLWRRRYNQSALIARRMALLLGATHAPLALRRTRRTPSQKGRAVDARFANLQGAIAPHPRHARRLAGREVALVDDVMTSGATLAACAEALREAGARRIVALPLARVARE